MAALVGVGAIGGSSFSDHGTWFRAKICSGSFDESRIERCRARRPGEVPVVDCGCGGLVLASFILDGHSQETFSPAPEQ